MSKTNQPYTKLGKMTAEEFDLLNRNTNKKVLFMLEEMLEGDSPTDKPSRKNLELLRNQKRLVLNFPFIWVHPNEDMLDYPAGLYLYKSPPSSYAPSPDGYEPSRFMIYRTVWGDIKRQIGDEEREAFDLIKAYIALSQALQGFQRDRHLLEIMGLPVNLTDLKIFR